MPTRKSFGATRHFSLPSPPPPTLLVPTTMTEVAELKKKPVPTAGAAPSSAASPAPAALVAPDDPKKPSCTAAGGMCYWPDQSCDSLPPLPGKVAAGLVGGRGMEFSVNEECELYGSILFIHCVVFVFLFFILVWFGCFCPHFCGCELF